MKRFVCVALSVLAVSCGGTSAQAPNAGGGRSGRGGRGAGTGGAQPVAIARVSQKDVPVDIAAVGNVESNTTISVRSQVTGQLQQAFFHEGDVVALPLEICLPSAVTGPVCGWSFAIRESSRASLAYGACR